MSNAVSQADHVSALQNAIEAGKDGMYLDALAHLQSIGSLRDWSGADRCDVSWIVQELGAPRLARWHILKSYREAPEVLSVRVAYGQYILEDDGPLDALEFAESKGVPTDANADAEDRLRWMYLQMAALTQLRDFAAAEQIIDQMQTINERVDMIHFA
ncbi:MAG: hypothetical protein R3C05_31795, partial [Pirellulaceae bacterium]